MRIECGCDGNERRTQKAPQSGILIPRYSKEPGQPARRVPSDPAADRPRAEPPGAPETPGSPIPGIHGSPPHQKAATGKFGKYGRMFKNKGSPILGGKILEGAHGVDSSAWNDAPPPTVVGWVVGACKGLLGMALAALCG